MHKVNQKTKELVLSSMSLPNTNSFF